MTLILRLLKRLVPALQVPVRSPLPRTVLVVDLNFLGDMLFSSPVYRALKEHLPDARVEALVYPFVRPVLAANPFVDAIQTVDRGGFLHQFPTFLALRKRRYDCVVQMNTSLKVNLIMWIIGARIRVGYDYRHRGAPNTVRIPLPTRTARSGNRVEECLRLIEQAFGWRIEKRSMVFSVQENDRQAVRALLRELKVGDGRLLVGMHTNCRQDWEQRRWSQEKFAKLAGQLQREHDATLLFTGAAEDGPYVSGILHGVADRSRAIDLTGRVTLSQFAALLQEIALFVTINTGPLHLAIACGTPTVAIIGGTPAEVVFPVGDPLRRCVEDPALRGWDPGATHWDYRPAIGEISVDQVMHEIRKVLELLKR